MDENKKRLVLFVGITFLITWIPFFVFLFSGESFLQEDGTLGGMANMLCALAMLCPSVGMLAARALTKEGFACTGRNSMMLGIDFSNKKWLFYLIAILLPWLYFELGALLHIAMMPEVFCAELPKQAGIDGVLPFLPLAAITNGVFVSFGALGEEAGWRGYMMPKLLKLMKPVPACILGGFIWGVWHWPMTYLGHNFGLDYMGYPYTGFLAMSLMPICVGMILSYLTYKTNSIWPAAFAHAVNNASPSILQCYIDSSRVSGWKADRFVTFVIQFAPMMLIGVGFLAAFAVSWKKQASKQCLCCQATGKVV